MAKRAFDNHLPHWTWSVGALHDKGAEVWFWCGRCRLLFVDLSHLIQVRGRGFSLVHRFARCKVSACRSRGVFVAAEHMHAMARLLERNKPDPARWKPLWTFARLEAEQPGGWASIPSRWSGSRFERPSRKRSRNPPEPEALTQNLVVKGSLS